MAGSGITDKALLLALAARWGAPGSPLEEFGTTGIVQGSIHQDLILESLNEYIALAQRLNHKDHFQLCLLHNIVAEMKYWVAA